MPTFNYFLRISLRNCIIKSKKYLQIFHIYCQVALLKDCAMLRSPEKKRECSLPYTFSTTGIAILSKSSLPNRVLIKTCHYYFHVISLCVKKVNHFHLCCGHLHLSFLLLLFLDLSLAQFYLSEIVHEVHLAAALDLWVKKKKKSLLDCISTMRTGLETVSFTLLTLHRASL